MFRLKMTIIKCLIFCCFSHTQTSTAGTCNYPNKHTHCDDKQMTVVVISFFKSWATQNFITIKTSWNTNG
jgi:hypothetical protein